MRIYLFGFNLVVVAYNVASAMNGNVWGYLYIVVSAAALGAIAVREVAEREVRLGRTDTLFYTVCNGAPHLIGKTVDEATRNAREGALVYALTPTHVLRGDGSWERLYSPDQEQVIRAETETSTA